MSISIPILSSFNAENAQWNQPIIQLKELEIDRVRYNEWKKLLTEPHRLKVIKEFTNDNLNNPSE